MSLKFRSLLLLSSVISAMLACQLPGMIPLTSQLDVDMETSTDRVIEVLNTEDWVALQSVVNEQYTEEDYSKPGTLTFTADVTNEQPVYFSYGWCTVDEPTLQQNFEHITVTMTLDGNELGDNVVHPLSFGQAGGLVCLDFGVLLSNWELGEYELKAAATFDEVINDGLADYDAGDYVFVYNVTVTE
jgi:hypothetical protein